MGEGAEGDRAGELRQEYELAMLAILSGFEVDLRDAGAGTMAVAARARAVDALICGFGPRLGEVRRYWARVSRWWQWAGMGGGSCFFFQMWT